MVRRVWLGLGGLAVVVAGIVFVLWTNSGPPAKPSPESAQPPQAGLPPSVPPAAPSAAIPSFDIVKVDPNGHAVIAGRAAPGAKVAVLDGDKTLGEVTADDRGEWVILPANPMPPGERQLTLEATDPATGAKTKSTDTVALAVAPPTANGAAPGTVAVLLPGNSNQPAQALQTPNGRGGLSLDTAEYNDKGQLMLSGHAPAGTTLRLYADNQPIGNAKTDDQGKWSSVSPRPGGPGKTELRIDQLGADGSVTQRIDEPFEPPTGTIATGQYKIEAGDALWVIARKTYGNGQHYTVIFGANKEHIRDPNLIYPGQVITLPKS
jgi:LysM repeat protein